MKQILLIGIFLAGGGFAGRSGTCLQKGHDSVVEKTLPAGLASAPGAQLPTPTPTPAPDDLLPLAAFLLLNN